MSQLVYDIGLYDGADTAYYLSCGHNLVAIEANPSLAAAASIRFAGAIQDGKLRVVNAALTDRLERVRLHISTSDLGSSSLRPGARNGAAETVEVQGITLDHLFEQYGLPHFVKIISKVVIGLPFFR